jgi:predicted metal-dependent hydrolase
MCFNEVVAIRNAAGVMAMQQNAQSNPNFEYTPKQVDDITVRAFTFEFPDDLDPIWTPDHRERSLLFNGLSLTMPYLEPFLIKNMQEATTHFDIPELNKDIRDFNGQEARHYQCHRRLNELLKRNGYPQLAEVETRMVTSFAKLSKTSLRTRLAYGAGFECMTNGITTWFINKRRELFAGASPHVTSFWLMHMIEETEHKTVAFDAYMAYSGQYLPRALGVLHGSFHILMYGYSGLFTALKEDGKLYSPRSLLGVARETLSLMRNITPFLLRALLPWHNPRGEADPQWMLDWITGHKHLPAGALIPLVDTANPDMPVPFPTHGAN